MSSSPALTIERNKAHLGVTFLYILWLIAIILYFTAPIGYSSSYIWYSFLIFGSGAIILLSNNIYRYKSLFIFEVLFTFSFIFVNYVYPIYIYTIDPYFSLFSRSFNENVISKSTALASLGYISFCIGIFQKKNLVVCRTRIIEFKPVSTVDLIILTCLFITFLISNLFALIGGFAMSGGGGFFFIFSIFYLYKYYAFSLNRISKSKRFYFFCLIFGFIVLNLIMGNRGEPLYLFVAIIFCQNKYIKKIPLSRFAILGILGLLVFYIVGKVRISENQVGIHSQSEKLASIEKEENIIRYANELIINNRALYVLTDYADKSGYTYGLTWSMNLFSIVPFGQSFALNILEIPKDMFSSASLTTSLEFEEGDENSFGLGTNLIGDIYLSFGAIGIVILMLLFGKVLKNIHNQSLFDRSYYQILYIILIILSVYYPRATLFSPLQMIAWTYALTLIYKKNGKVYLRSLRRIPIQK